MRTPYTLNTNEREAVLKGGRIVHVLPVNENGRAERMAKALCGKGPSEQRGGAFKRAGWYGTAQQVDCPACLAILAERGS